VRKVVVQVFDYSLDGIFAQEDTDFFEFCRELPDDSGLEAWRLGSFERADVHIMGRKMYEGAAHRQRDGRARLPQAPLSSIVTGAGRG
jgi:hypothetical protein